jgi:hypothetical protein
MKITQIEQIKDFTPVNAVADNQIVDKIYTSDILSDILTNGNNADILITIQNHINTIAVAAQCKISAIIICNGKEINKNLIKLADENSIALFRTDKNQYEASVAIHLYKNKSYI